MKRLVLAVLLAMGCGGEEAPAIYDPCVSDLDCPAGAFCAMGDPAPFCSTRCEIPPSDIPCMGPDHECAATVCWPDDICGGGCCQLVLFEDDYCRITAESL